jgi:hypothetical protein
MATPPTYEELVEQLSQKDQTIRQLEHQHEQDIHEIQRLHKLIEIKDSITFNKGMSYSERNQMQGIVANHPDQVLKGEKFEIDVWKERQAVGISHDTSSKLLFALNEVGGIEYNVTTSKVDGKPQSKSTIAIDLGAIATVNTKDATKRVQQREAVNKKRLERVNHPVCPGCGSADHVDGVLTPVCMKCEIALEDQRQLIKLPNLFIQIEDASFVDSTLSTLAVNENSPSITDTHTMDEPDYIRDGYGDECPIEPDYIRDSFNSPELELVSAVSVSKPQQSLFPDSPKKQVTPATLTHHGHPLPPRACLKCGVQDWRWDDVLDTPICGNCG